MPKLTVSQLPSPTQLPTPMASPAVTSIPYRPPTWFKNAVLYEIYVRSYADSNEDGVGDLRGIQGKLDYLQSLGVTAIWLMPIHPSVSVHGYDVVDYFSVNPDYGTRSDLIALVDEAHNRGMRILLDFVPSHVSDEHPLFREAYANPQSSYAEWFLWLDEAHTTYLSFAGVKDMPRFNHFNPSVVDYLCEVALYWLDLDQDGDYRDGVDGFRVDNVVFPPTSFFETLRAKVKDANPEALLLGEAWVHDPVYLEPYFSHGFDALFDFPLYEIIQGHQDLNHDGLLMGNSLPMFLDAHFVKESELFPPEALAVHFANNHDTNRTASEVSGDYARLRLAAALLSTLPGPFMIYYGEEIGMFGEKGGPPHWDSYRREPMDWYEDGVGPDQTTWFQPEDRWNRAGDGVSVEAEEDDPDSLLNFYRRVLQLRRNLPALRGGSFDLLELQPSDSGPWGFVRESETQRVRILVNFAADTRQVSIAAPRFQAPSVEDALTGQSFPCPAVGEACTLQLAPGGILVLVD